MPLNDHFIYQPPQEPLEIMYEDEDLVVVNKPAGLLSVMGRLP
ncbi:MAG: RNA pseudouridine synthase, partial [Acinetobacter junii]